MITCTEQEAMHAAKQFCYSLDWWASDLIFSDEKEQSNLVTDELGYYVLDKKAEERFSNCFFVHNMSMIYQFAKAGSWENEFIFESSAYLEDRVNEVLTPFAAYLEIFTSAEMNFHDESGTDDIIDKRILATILNVLDLAFARFRLLIGDDVTLEQLAALANVNLKTVRNALSLKGVNQLVQIGVDHKGNTTVECAEALRWLESKKGYSGPLFLEDRPHYTSYINLGQLQYHCLSLIKHSGLNWSTLEKVPGWDSSVTDAFIKLSKLKVGESISLITPPVLKIFGEATNVPDIALFVIESSKIVGATSSEFQATQLFSQS
jgi:hypothetical protein